MNYRPARLLAPYLLGVSLCGAAFADEYIVRVPIAPTAHAPNTTVTQLGDVPVGSFVSQSFVFRNRGSEPTTVAWITKNGAPLTIVSDQCSGKTLAAGEVCPIATRFAPTALGPFEGSLSVGHTSALLPDIFIGRGTGVDASLRLQFDPDVLSFGDVARGTSSIRVLSITNQSGDDLFVLDVSVQQGGSTSFQVVSHDCDLLGAGDSCAAQVRFIPTALGYQQARIGVETDSGNVISGTALTGTGVQAEAVLTPGMLSFTGTAVGHVSEPLAATLTNAGKAPLGFVRAEVVGSNVFSVTGHNCPSTLSPGQHCALQVVASLQDETVKSGALRVLTTNTPTASVQIDLQAYPRAANPALEWAPASLGFEGLGVGLSATRTLSIRSKGETDAVVSGFSFSGSHAGDFSLVNPAQCIGSLAPGMECELTVRFSPSAAGSRIASLQVQANLPETPAGASLSGAGLPGVLGATPEELVFSEVYPGDSVTRAVTIGNAGPGYVDIGVLSLAGAQKNLFSASGCAAARLGPAQSCDIQVTFSPTATGSVSASLMLTHSGQGGTLTVPLSSSVAVRPVSQPVLGLFSCTSVVAGEQAECTATLRNTGLAPLAISGIQLTNSIFDAPSHDCGTTLAPGAQCRLTVTGTFALPGAYQTNVSVTTDNGTPGAIASVNVLAPDSELLPPTFGSVRVGESVQSAAVLRNTGASGVLQVTGAPTLTGSSAFSLQGSSCSGALATGETCSIAVSCSPAAVGELTGTLNVPTNGGVFSAPLRCVASAAPTPVVSLSDVQCAAGWVGASTSCVAVLSNTGDGALSVGNPTRTGTLFGAPSHNCGSSLAPGGSCVLTMNQTFSSAGTFSTTVSWPLAGTPVTRAAAILIQASDVQLTAPPTAVTQAGTPVNMEAVLRHVSGGAVSVGAPSVSGTGMSLLASTCSSQLSPGGVCTLTVRCNPAAPGTQMGALVVPTGAGVKSVALTCQAQAAQLSVSVPGRTTDVGTGSLSGNWVTVTNSGLGAVTVSELRADAPNFSLFANPSNSAHCNPGRVLAAGESCQVLETVLGTATGGSVMEYRSPLRAAVVTSGASATWDSTYRVYGVAIDQITATSAMSPGVAYDVQYRVTNMAPHALSAPRLVATAGAGGTATIITNGCTTTVTAFGQCLVTIRVTPAANTTASHFSYTLSANGRYPQVLNSSLFASPAEALVGTRSFTVLVGAPLGVLTIDQHDGARAGETDTKTHFFENTGHVPVAVTSVTSSSAVVFPITSNGCLGITLQPGERCNITTEFRPTLVARNHTSNLVVAYSGKTAQGTLRANSFATGDVSVSVTAELSRVIVTVTAETVSSSLKALVPMPDLEAVTGNNVWLENSPVCTTGVSTVVQCQFSKDGQVIAAPTRTSTAITRYNVAWPISGDKNRLGYRATAEIIPFETDDANPDNNRAEGHYMDNVCAREVVTYVAPNVNAVLHPRRRASTLWLSPTQFYCHRREPGFSTQSDGGKTTNYTYFIEPFREIHEGNIVNLITAGHWRYTSTATGGFVTASYGPTNAGEKHVYNGQTREFIVKTEHATSSGSHRHYLEYYQGNQKVRTYGPGSVCRSGADLVLDPVRMVAHMQACWSDNLTGLTSSNQQVSARTVDLRTGQVTAAPIPHDPHGFDWVQNRIFSFTRQTVYHVDTRVVQAYPIPGIEQVPSTLRNNSAKDWYFDGESRFWGFDTTAARAYMIDVSGSTGRLKTYPMPQAMPMWFGGYSPYPVPHITSSYQSKDLVFIIPPEERPSTRGPYIQGY